MQLAEGIRRIGFRKWYERTMLASHAHLVLCFLCLIGVFAAFEAAGERSGAGKLPNMAAALLCAGIGLWALRRYLGLMGHAESAANQAECPQCQSYGRLELVAVEGDGTVVRVRCRRCGHGWEIEP